MIKNKKKDYTLILLLGIIVLVSPIFLFKDSITKINNSEFKKKQELYRITQSIDSLKLEYNDLRIDLEKSIDKKNEFLIALKSKIFKLDLSKDGKKLRNQKSQLLKEIDIEISNNTNMLNKALIDSPALIIDNEHENVDEKE